MSHNVTVQNINIPNISVIERAVKELQAAGSKITISSAPGKFRGYMNSMTDAERVITIAGSNYQIGVVKTDKAFTLSYDQSMCARDQAYQASMGCDRDALGVDGKPLPAHDYTRAVGRLVQLCNVISAEDQAGYEGHMCVRSYNKKTKQYELEIEEAV